MIFALKFLFTFLSMVATDVAWTVYFLKVEERNPKLAALWSSIIMLCSIMVTTSYVDDRRLFPAAILGAFVGTYIVVEHKRRKELKQKNGQ